MLVIGWVHEQLVAATIPRKRILDEQKLIILSISLSLSVCLSPSFSPLSHGHIQTWTTNNEEEIDGNAMEVRRKCIRVMFTVWRIYQFTEHRDGNWMTTLTMNDTSVYDETDDTVHRHTGRARWLCVPELSAYTVRTRSLFKIYVSASGSDVRFKEECRLLLKFLIKFNTSHTSHTQRTTYEVNMYL